MLLFELMLMLLVLLAMARIERKRLHLPLLGMLLLALPLLSIVRLTLMTLMSLLLLVFLLLLLLLLLLDGGVRLRGRVRLCRLLELVLRREAGRVLVLLGRWRDSSRRGIRGGSRKGWVGAPVTDLVSWRLHVIRRHRV